MSRETVIGVDLSGPIFDGRADVTIAEACQRAQHELGEVGLSAVRAHTTAFRHPTGRFLSKLDLRDYKHGSVVAAPLIYGDWLEGVGSKNRSRHFAGYRMWAIARAVVKAAARPIVQAVMDRAAESCN